jgi:hypothetical protein
MVLLLSMLFSINAAYIEACVWADASGACDIVAYKAAAYRK